MIGGEVSDRIHLEVSLDIGPDITPRVALTDKGYDVTINRAARRKRGIIPVIPHRSNSKNRADFFPKLLEKARARVELAPGTLPPKWRQAINAAVARLNLDDKNVEQAIRDAWAQGGFGMARDTVDCGSQGLGPLRLDN